MLAVVVDEEKPVSVTFWSISSSPPEESLKSDTICRVDVLPPDKSRSAVLSLPWVVPVPAVPAAAEGSQAEKLTPASCPDKAATSRAIFQGCKFDTKVLGRCQLGSRGWQITPSAESGARWAKGDRETGRQKRSNFVLRGISDVHRGVWIAFSPTTRYFVYTCRNSLVKERLRPYCWKKGSAPTMTAKDDQIYELSPLEPKKTRG